MAANPLRQLPSVDALLGLAQDTAARHGRPATVAAIRAALAEARSAGEPRSPEQLLARAAALLERPPSLRPVLNATGVIVHTNLGRAPLAASALERVRAVASGYSNLEYDLSAGARGSRHTHLGGAPGRAHRGRGGDGGEQQRGGGAAQPGGARRRTRGAHQPR